MSKHKDKAQQTSRTKT